MNEILSKRKQFTITTINYQGQNNLNPFVKHWVDTNKNLKQINSTEKTLTRCSSNLSHQVGSIFSNETIRDEAINYVKRVKTPIKQKQSKQNIYFAPKKTSLQINYKVKVNYCVLIQSFFRGYLIRKKMWQKQRKDTIIYHTSTPFINNERFCEFSFEKEKHIKFSPKNYGMISNLIPSKRIESITLCFNSDYKRPIHHRAVLYIKNEFYSKKIIKRSQYAKSMIILIQYNVRHFLIRKRLSISSELNYSFNTLNSYQSINLDNNMYKRQTNPIIQKKILKLSHHLDSSAREFDIESELNSSIYHRKYVNKTSTLNQNLNEYIDNNDKGMKDYYDIRYSYKEPREQSKISMINISRSPIRKKAIYNAQTCPANSPQLSSRSLENIEEVSSPRASIKIYKGPIKPKKLIKEEKEIKIDNTNIKETLQKVDNKRCIIIFTKEYIAIETNDEIYYIGNERNITVDREIKTRARKKGKTISVLNVDLYKMLYENKHTIFWYEGNVRKKEKNRNRLFRTINEKEEKSIHEDKDIRAKKMKKKKYFSIMNEIEKIVNENFRLYKKQWYKRGSCDCNSNDIRYKDSDFYLGWNKSLISRYKEILKKEKKEKDILIKGEGMKPEKEGEFCDNTNQEEEQKKLFVKRKLKNKTIKDNKKRKVQKRIDKLFINTEEEEEDLYDYKNVDAADKPIEKNINKIKNTNKEEIVDLIKCLKTVDIGIDYIQVMIVPKALQGNIFIDDNDQENELSIIKEWKETIPIKYEKESEEIENLNEIINKEKRNNCVNHHSHIPQPFKSSTSKKKILLFFHKKEDNCTINNTLLSHKPLQKDVIIQNRNKLSDYSKSPSIVCLCRINDIRIFNNQKNILDKRYLEIDDKEIRVQEDLLLSQVPSLKVFLVNVTTNEEKRHKFNHILCSKFKSLIISNRKKSTYEFLLIQKESILPIYNDISLIPKKPSDKRIKILKTNQEQIKKDEVENKYTSKEIKSFHHLQSTPIGSLDINESQTNESRETDVSTSNNMISQIMRNSIMNNNKEEILVKEFNYSSSTKIISDNSIHNKKIVSLFKDEDTLQDENVLYKDEPIKHIRKSTNEMYNVIDNSNKKEDCIKIINHYNRNDIIPLSKNNQVKKVLLNSLCFKIKEDEKTILINNSTISQHCTNTFMLIDNINKKECNEKISTLLKLSTNLDTTSHFKDDKRIKKYFLLEQNQENKIKDSNENILKPFGNDYEYISNTNHHQIIPKSNLYTINYNINRNTNKSNKISRLIKNQSIEKNINEEKLILDIHPIHKPNLSLTENKVEEKYEPFYKVENTIHNEFVNKLTPPMLGSDNVITKYYCEKERLTLNVNNSKKSMKRLFIHDHQKNNVLRRQNEENVNIEYSEIKEEKPNKEILINNPNALDNTTRIPQQINRMRIIPNKNSLIYKKSLNRVFFSERAKEDSINIMSKSLIKKPSTEPSEILNTNKEEKEDNNNSYKNNLSIPTKIQNPISSKSINKLYLSYTTKEQKEIIHSLPNPKPYKKSFHINNSTKLTNLLHNKASNANVLINSSSNETILFIQNHNKVLRNKIVILKTTKEPKESNISQGNIAYRPFKKVRPMYNVLPIEINQRTIISRCTNIYKKKENKKNTKIEEITLKYKNKKEVQKEDGIIKQLNNKIYNTENKPIMIYKDIDNNNKEDNCIKPLKESFICQVTHIIRTNKDIIDKTKEDVLNMNMNFAVHPKKQKKKKIIKKKLVIKKNSTNEQISIDTLRSQYQNTNLIVRSDTIQLNDGDNDEEIKYSQSTLNNSSINII